MTQCLNQTKKKMEKKLNRVLLAKYIVFNLSFEMRFLYILLCCSSDKNCLEHPFYYS